ncbi:hypothetical protein HHK36_001285 [Tetracentron sinense]|uniref:HAT C-terminal dimerisation domain-containing protein n=1 Tax=Tetracentron sinense TaxID=13715 RepID=A0A834ZVS8_TETSI|nr:hypothetical protein HHK36_001285 [Tetracentron sinense]
MSGLYDVIERLIPEVEIQDKISRELILYKNAEGLFGRTLAIQQRDTLPPAEWWDNYRASTPHLQQLACQILSLTCSASGCERNWSVFEHIHTKKRNILEQNKLNDLVYVHYNQKLVERFKARNSLDPITLRDINDCNEWLIGSMQEQLVYEEDDLTWDQVAEASVANEHRVWLTRSRLQSLQRGVDDEPLSDETESDGEEQYIEEADNNDSDGGDDEIEDEALLNSLLDEDDK